VLLIELGLLYIHLNRNGYRKGGTGVEELKNELEAITEKQVQINVMEVKVPELDAQLISENIAAQLEKRISFRRL